MDILIWDIWTMKITMNKKSFWLVCCPKFYTLDMLLWYYGHILYTYRIITITNVLYCAFLILIILFDTDIININPLWGEVSRYVRTFVYSNRLKIILCKRRVCGEKSWSVEYQSCCCRWKPNRKDYLSCSYSVTKCSCTVKKQATENNR